MVDRGSFSMMNKLAFIDERVRAHAPVSRNEELPESWTPQPWSVLCGRGKDCFNHVGNRRFRLLVDINLPKYAAAKSKLAKTTIVVGILDAIREGTNHVGGFVKLNPKTNRWFEVGDEVAREKIGQQFRVAMAATTKPTPKTKKESKMNDDKPEQSSSSTTSTPRRVSKSKMAIKIRSRPISPETVSSITPPVVVVDTEDSSVVVDDCSTYSSHSSSSSSDDDGQFSPLPFSAIVDDDVFTGELLDFELDTNEQEEALLHVIAI